MYIKRVILIIYFTIGYILINKRRQVVKRTKDLIEGL